MNLQFCLGSRRSITAPPYRVYTIYHYWLPLAWFFVPFLLHGVAKLVCYWDYWRPLGLLRGARVPAIHEPTKPVCIVALSPRAAVPEKELIRGMSKKLFVGGLSWGTTDDGSPQRFSPYGEIIEAKVITDRETGRSRGFGFVTFSNDEGATKAITEMNGTELDGRTIKVNEAEDKPPAAAAVVAAVVDAAGTAAAAAAADAADAAADAADAAADDATSFDGRPPLDGQVFPK